MLHNFCWKFDENLLVQFDDGLLKAMVKGLVIQGKHIKVL